MSCDQNLTALRGAIVFYFLLHKQLVFLLRFLLSSQEFIKMMSVCFFVLIFLAGKTEDKKDLEDNCCWECKFDSMNKNVNLSSELNWKMVLYQTGHMRTKFLVNKRGEQGCSSSKENTSEPLEVWIYMAQDQASSIYGSSSFGLLSFAIMNILDDVTSLRFLFPELFKRKDLENEVNNSISCVFRQTSRWWQTSNESNGLCANGLEAITSPYFYIKEVDNFTQNKPFLSYIWWKSNVAVYAGLTNPDGNSQTAAKNGQHRQIIEGWRYVVLSVLSHVVGIYFTLYGVYYVMCKFQSNVSTVEIPETPISAISPADRTEEVEILALTYQPNRAPKVPVTPGQPTPTLQEDVVKRENVLNRAVKDDTTFGETVTSIQERGRYCVEESKLVDGLGKSTKNFRRSHSSIPSISPGSFNAPQSSSIVNLFPDADSISPIQSGDSVAEASTLNQETQAQARLRDNRKRKLVRVINLPGDFSSVGLTSFISNTLLKSKYVGYVNLSVFISGPLFFALFLDFLCLPRVLFRSAPSLISTSLTKSVLLYIFQKSPKMLVCCVVYIIRCGCLCFCKPSRKTWVSGFVDRKHVLCFLRGCYVAQLFFSKYASSACHECKEGQLACLQEINIAENLRRNFQGLDQVIMKVWKDVFGSALADANKSTSHTNNDNYNDNDNNGSTFKFTNNYGYSVCCNIGNSIGAALCYIFKFILFLILCILDLALSSPIVSFCFLRVWFSVYSGKINRYKQFLFLLVEFFFINSSVAWAVYTSFCCSVSLEVAVSSLFMTGAKYFIETLSTYATIILFWYVVLGYYRSFTDKYNNLDLLLFNTCIADHKEQLEQYQRGDEKVYFPEDLVMSVHKLIPLGDSIRSLVQSLMSCFVSFIFMMLGLTGTELPNTQILPVAVTIMAIVPPALKWLFTDNGKLKELNDKKLEQTVKKLVQEYFKQKKD